MLLTENALIKNLKKATPFSPRLLKLAIGTWNVTFLMGKEPELVREVERYRLK